MRVEDVENERKQRNKGVKTGIRVRRKGHDETSRRRGGRRKERRQTVFIQKQRYKGVEILHIINR